jgi:hypothetical protein
VFQIASISDLWVYKPGEMRDFNLKASGSLSRRGLFLPLSLVSFPSALFLICMVIPYRRSNCFIDRSIELSFLLKLEFGPVTFPYPSCMLFPFVLVSAQS